MASNVSLDVVDEVFAEFHASVTTPGLAYGVITGGALIHFGSFGVAAADSTPSAAISADSVFRIASMTKSFTAAAVLKLRDEQRLSLDDTVATYVPELRGQRMPTSDAPELTIRHLLTMSGGLSTDDPWADRLESMPRDGFSRLLESGITFAMTPGTGYEYSDLGYAILGRVIEAAASRPYWEFVGTELLAPMGMTSTTFDPAVFTVVTGDITWSLSIAVESASVEHPTVTQCSLVPIPRTNVDSD